MRFPKIKIYKFDKKRFWGCAFAVLVVVAGTVAIFFPTNTYKTIEINNSFYKPAEFDVNDYELPSYLWKDLGYDSVIACHDDLVAKREEAAGAADGAIDLYSIVITDEEKELLKTYESGMTGALTIVKYNEYLDLFNELTDELDMRMPVISYETVSNGSSSNSNSGSNYYTSNGSGLTKSSGINYYNGRKETYYSSRVLYHYRTGEWTVDNEGFYRDSNGYYVVATSDMTPGTVFEGSKGMCISLDSGCDTNVTDYYVSW